MNLRPLLPHLLVSDQLLPADVPALARQGIASVLCNRPDGEQPNQPDHLALQAACMSAGMHFAYLPVVADAISDHQVQQFAELLEQLPVPIAAYCRTGMRSTSLWALSQVRTAGATAGQVVSVAAAAGYDIAALAPRLRPPAPSNF